MSSAKIQGNIVSVKLADSKPKEHVIIQTVSEKTKRPRRTDGSTYKLKTPLAKSSLFITINNIVLNEGTEYETVQPFEMFINGKEMDNFQWVVAVTLLVSAIFRKGGDVTFIIEELKSVFDPRGGYLSKKGHVSSLVAEIGSIVEEHFIHIGLIAEDTSFAEILEEKKQQHLAKGGSLNGSTCSKCKMDTVIRLDGCPTCLNCGDSKCS